MESFKFVEILPICELEICTIQKLRFFLKNEGLKMNKVRGEFLEKIMIMNEGMS